MRTVNREAILDAVRHFLDQSVDGIVVIVPHSDTLLALAEVKAGVPVVAVGSLGDASVGGAMVDQKRGAELAVRHLVEQGHRRIGHVAGPQDWIDGVARAEGWSEALQAAGLQDDLLVVGTGAPAAAMTSAGSLPVKGPPRRFLWEMTRWPWACCVRSTRQVSGCPRMFRWWVSTTSPNQAISRRL